MVCWNKFPPGNNSSFIALIETDDDCVMLVDFYLYSLPIEKKDTAGQQKSAWCPLQERKILFNPFPTANAFWEAQRCSGGWVGEPGVGKGRRWEVSGWCLQHNFTLMDMSSTAR